MHCIVPEGVYSMKGRSKIIWENSSLYRKTSKKEKSRLLDELTHMLKFNRKYLAYLLRNSGRVIKTPQGVRLLADPRINLLSRRGRKKTYSKELLPYLTAVWELSGFLSSVHLVAFLKAHEGFLFTHQRFKNAREEVKKKLLEISSSTIDRMLKPCREKVFNRKKYKGNPFASSIKRSIPVSGWYDRPRELGYVELDLVHHCGKSGRGDFCYTLTFTEVATGYTELRSLRNKAQIWTLQALVEIMENLPFKIVHLHCDNGSEFINGHLRRFTLRENLDFSRSRAYHKNDAAYAESKNWSMVRRYTGYQRYDSEEEWMVLEELMKLISIKHNYFIPTMKLVSKERVGLKVRKRYDVHTPYERLQKSELVSRESKERLEQYKRSLDYFAIQKRIIRLSEKLEQSYRNKYTKDKGWLKDEEFIKVQ